MVTTQTADKVLKSYYLDVVSDMLDKTTNPFLAAIKKTTSDVWGRDVRKTMRIGVNGGVGAGTEDGALPKATGNRYVQLVSTLKNLYGTIEITDKALRASASSEGAFINLLNDEMESLVRSSAFNFSRMLFGNGSGKLATIQDVIGTKYTVDAVDKLFEGMVIDIIAPNGDVCASGVTINEVNRGSLQIFLPIGDIPNVAGASVYLQNSKDLEITGLGAIFGNQDLYGVERVFSNPWMYPNLYEDVEELTEEKILKAFDDVEEVSGGKVNFIVTSWAVRRKLYALLASQKRADTMELEGGYRALSFNGVPVVVDRFCPKDAMYLLNTDDFALHQLCDWQWLEGEDGKILKQIAGKPVFTATLVKYAELLCYRPCGQAALLGITVD